MNYGHLVIAYLAGLVTLPLMLAFGYRLMRYKDERDRRRYERPHR